MIKYFYLLAILSVIIIPRQSDLIAQSGLPDSLIHQATVMDVGETWRTGTATSFGHFTINAYFKEPNGIHHLAYVDNYKLFYFKSTDNGLSWSKEQVITGHEGDIQNCILTVDTAGKVFIGITVHDLYNYANPTGITDGYSYFLYDAYCITNKTGSWVTETVMIHTGNYGPKVAGMFVDALNNVHFLANYYGWYSNGGTAWEWVRNSETNTWGARQTVVTFGDAGIDRFIYDVYSIVQGPQDTVTLLMCRYYPTNLTRLFYVRFDGTAWSAPVNITDTLAIAYNRFDAVIDPAGNTYLAYEQNNAQGLPVIKVMKNFQPAQTAVINLAQTDTLYYFRLHCNSEGRFTMYLTIKNQNPRITFSDDMINWSEPIAAPDDIKNYIGGVIVRTDTRRGYFADHCQQVTAIAGPRTALPYGPDTLVFGSIRVLDAASSPALISPPDVSVVDTDYVTFTWSASGPEVTHYWIEIDTTSGFNSPFADSAITGTSYEYSGLTAYQTYYWRVKAKNLRGWGEYSDTYTFNAVFVSVGDEAGLPSAYMLGQNYPNPFNPVTTIHYELPKESIVSLKVYDLLGQEMMTILSERREAGRYDVSFDGASLSSGIYFYRMQANDYIQTRKFVVIK